MVDAQEWLDKEYPQEEIKKTKQVLQIDSKNLTGTLDLKDFVNLRCLSCNDNQLTNLNNLSNLKVIGCSNNLLTNFDYSDLNPELTFLNISNNNLSQQDCSVFSHLVNLEGLCIGNPKKITKRCSGSLAPLATLIKLKHLDITNTNFKEGLQYLPENLERLYCSGCPELEKQLTGYKKDNYYDYQSWRKDNQEKFLKMQEEETNFLNVEHNKTKQKLFSKIFSKGDQKESAIAKLISNSNNLATKIATELVIENWKENNYPFKNFTEKLTQEWIICGFNKQETGKWLENGLKIDDSGYVQWLKIIKNKEWSLSYDDVEKLREEYKLFLEEVRNGSKISVETIKQIKNFKHSFDSYIDYNEVVKGTSKFREDLTQEEEIFVEKLVTNSNLRERYKKYGLCKECKQPNTGNNYGSSWCWSCNSRHFQDNFKNWTSSNLEIDRFIRQYQLEAINSDGILEWIPYEKFTDVEYLAEGGFGKVYKARWIDGWIDYWSSKDNKWERHNRRGLGKEVVLKILNNSQNIKGDFLQEIYYHRLFGAIDFVVECYGISQDPITNNYAMVINYFHNSNLRKYLKDDYSKLNFKDKIDKLRLIATGLNSIHEKGLIHRDFHSGNVLISDKNFCAITDLGLCRPANSQKENREIFGVLPYVAPEVLQGQPYTQASDIYSFGIMACEVFSGLSPFHEYAHDEDLTMKIYRGLRPKFRIEIPQLLEDFINQCWNANPSERPTSTKLLDTLLDWFVELEMEDEKQEFYCQYQKIEKVNQKSSPNLISYQIHPQAIYTSQLINTKQIVQLFRESEEKALEQEIKKIEQEIDQPLTEELKELVSGFIQVRKEITKDENDEAAEDKAWALEDKLEEKNLSKENIEKIMKYCERFIKAEQQQLEQEQLSAQIEIQTNK